MKLATLQELSDSFWEEYQFIYPELIQYRPPKIILSDKLVNAWGYAHFEESIICISSMHLESYTNYMIHVIIPHESAHCMDYLINGWYPRKRYHGKSWQEIMVNIGQTPDPIPKGF